MALPRAAGNSRDFNGLTRGFGGVGVIDPQGFSALPPNPSELRDLADRVRRLPDPLRASPEKIYAEKDEIAKRLIYLARRLERAA